LAGYHWPQISIHRGTLQRVLLDAVIARLGPARLKLGHALVGFMQTSRGVVPKFVDRQQAPLAGVAPYDVLVGADGIHSRVRSLLHPHEGAPSWNGTLLWRGLTRGEAFLSGRTMIMAGHADQKFVAYPIGRAEDGRVLLNWIAELRTPRGDLTVAEDWSTSGKLSDFLPRFADWKFDWLDVPQLVESADLVCVYPLLDRDPLERWGEGRVTLLGDAAHPMYPVGSNGASQAILDARVLTSCLRHGARDLPSALQSYEATRLPATAALTLANRKQGPEECMTLVEARAPDGFQEIAQVISPDELAAISAKYKRLAGFSVDDLNLRPSLAQVRYGQSAREPS
jgi:2-polyprenyl-6-methoxyphenol hydroxylase-like FAD-dependent oxidoreductase